MPMNVLKLPKSLALRAILSLALGGLVCNSAMAQNATTKGHPNTDGWQDLFAPDLSNAIMEPGGWVWQKGELVAKNHGTLWTKASYSNFILDLEFKVAPGANSGVFLRSSNIKNVLAALEIQVHASTDGAQYGMVGALYNCKPPSKRMEKPVGQWNHFTITCRDSHLSLVFNGEQVQNLDLNDWKEPHKNPDGTRNKFAVALKDFARSGPIGLQGLHGSAAAPVWYRHIKIKVLD